MEALPPRRKACDRCRRHKLRCVREVDNGNTEACTRCLRADTFCVTSAAAKIGKTTRVSESRHSRQNRLQDLVEPSSSVHPTSAHPRAQVFTPASTVVADQTNSSIAAARDNDGHYLPHSLLSPSFTHPDTLGTTNPNVAHSCNRLLGSDSPSLDVLDPSRSRALPPALNRREECVRKLAGLHSTLVLDLDIARGCQTADQCLAIVKMPEFSKNYNFVIGRMLSSSAKLIEVLQYFVPSSNEVQLSDIVRCDFPTLSSICTCYTYVIRIHRTVLTSIYESIVNPPAPPETLPPIFPGLELGGYSLEPHLDLQVKILVQVCEEMLAKINKLMGMEIQPNAGAVPGLLGCHETSAQMLNDMLENELSEEHEEGILVGKQHSLAEIFQTLRQV